MTCGGVEWEWLSADEPDSIPGSLRSVSLYLLLVVTHNPDIDFPTHLKMARLP